MKLLHILLHGNVIAVSLADLITIVMFVSILLENWTGIGHGLYEQWLNGLAINQSI